MELFKLVGVLFVVVGFILKWDTIATVVAAGIITGLVAMMNGTMTFIEILKRSVHRLYPSELPPCLG